MSEKYLEKKINDLLKEKKDKGIIPLAISLTALYSSIHDDTKTILGKLFDEKKINTFGTINDKMIEKI